MSRLVSASRTAAQRVSNWVDLQYSYIDEQLKAAGPRARGRMLDVGCGDKPYEHFFAPYVDSYIGVEHEATFSQTNAASSDRKPDVLYDGGRLPFEDASFDTVMSIQVLEHTPAPQLLVDEMCRVLAPGGLLILCAPFSFRLHEEPYDFFRYTPHGLRSMLAGAGLEIEETWSQGDLWSVLAHKLNSYLAFRLVGIQGLAARLGKMKHETKGHERASRLWLLPMVAPTMVAASAAARVLDRIAPDGTESLSYLLLARRAITRP
jgi:SAM-dependent methyltransferase